MTHFSHYAFSSMKLVLVAGVLATAACATRPVAPPPAVPEAEGPTATTHSGVAEQQPPPSDDIQFVTADHKEAATHDQDTPATSLHADDTARKQRVAR
jgi:hypothetical protein